MVQHHVPLFKFLSYSAIRWLTTTYLTARNFPLKNWSHDQGEGREGCQIELQLRKGTRKQRGAARTQAAAHPGKPKAFFCRGPDATDTRERWQRRRAHLKSSRGTEIGGTRNSQTLRVWGLSIPLTGKRLAIQWLSMMNEIAKSGSMCGK